MILTMARMYSVGRSMATSALPTMSLATVSFSLLFSLVQMWFEVIVVVGC